MTSRCAGLGLVLAATLAIAGCTQSEPPAPQKGVPAPEVAAPAPEASPAAPAVPAAVDAPAPAAPPETAKPAADAPQAPAESKPDGQKSPTPIGAIGKAISGALGMQKDDEPSEAPPYQPAQ